MRRTGVFRVLNIIKNIICWTLIVCLVSMLVIFFISRVNGETPSVFGYSILRVSSGSMKPELMVGDVIIDKKPENVAEIKKGDVVTFKGSGNLSGRLVTHKVIKAPYHENGVLMLQTRGIANEIADEPIPTTDVTGIMVCKVPFLNTVFSVFLSPWGLIILIGLILLVFFDEIIAIIKILTGTSEPEKREDINEIITRLQKDKLLEQAGERADKKSAEENNNIKLCDCDEEDSLS